MNYGILVSGASAVIAGQCILLVYIVGNASMYENNHSVILVPLVSAIVFLVTSGVMLLWGMMG